MVDEINEEDDWLNQFTNPEKIKQAELEAARSNFRPKWTEAIVDFGDLYGPYVAKLQDGTEVKRIKYDLSNVEILDTIDGSIIMDTEMQLEIGLPRKPGSNTEIALFVASFMKLRSDVNSNPKLISGLKKVHLKEMIHTYKGRRPTGQKEINTKVGTAKYGQEVDIWGDFDIPVYYYAAVAIDGKQDAVDGKGTPDAPVAPSAEALANAHKMVQEIPEEGIEEAMFKGKAMRDKVIQSDNVMMNLISHGQFIQEMVDTGIIERDKDTNLLMLVK